jgi:hypothetical protein
MCMCVFWESGGTPDPTMIHSPIHKNPTNF